MRKKQADPFSQALQLHQSGRIPEAIARYLELLPTRASDAQLLYLLGTAFHQLGQHEQGIRWLERSLALDPGNAFALNNQGTALYALGRLDEALACYAQATALQPDYVDAHFNRGNVLRDLGQRDDALASYDAAIARQADHVAAHSNRGTTLHELGRLEEALASFDRALGLNPRHAEAWNNRGNVLGDLGRPDDALASYEEAIALNDGYAEAYNNRGVQLQALKRHEEAVASYDRAVGLKPEYAEAWNNFGNALQDIGQLDDALTCFDNALHLEPDLVDACNNRGNLLRKLNRPDEALESYDRALALRPDYAEVASNRGNALQDLGRIDEALASFDRAIALDPGYAETYWNKALAKLLAGNYREGWELYEWRLRKPDTRDRFYRFPQPAWRGEASIRGRRLLVHTEQGFGDLVQFCRYLPKIHAMGAEIVLEAQKPLISLISTLDCPMTVVAKGEPLPEFDAYCPVMSLPYAFGTTLDTIPARVPYLSAAPGKARDWQQALGERDRPRIGIVWSGSTTHQNDSNRSIPLEHLLPLTTRPIEIHSLQKEYRPQDLDVLSRHPAIRQHQHSLGDFSDTAALIQCLDLVISVDTSVAHVAGALGKPVWILLPFAPDPRWLLHRQDSPWYPSARLFRQPSIGDWESVIDSVGQELDALVSPTR